MKGYKGFDPGLICRGKQYAENTVFEENNAEIYKQGMHFCENPIKEKGKTMKEKQRLMKILSVPIYPLVNADPTEVVADYLLDNDVVPVVRCKDCVYNENGTCTHSEYFDDTKYRPDYFCADGERKGE